MNREPSSSVVAARLAELRARFVPESVEEGRRRLEAERPPPSEPFEVRVSRRLTELRALCELASYLQQR